MAITVEEAVTKLDLKAGDVLLLDARAIDFPTAQALVLPKGCSILALVPQQGRSLVGSIQSIRLDALEAIVAEMKRKMTTAAAEAEKSKLVIAEG